MTDTTTVLRQALDVFEIVRDLHCLPGPVTTLVYQAIRSIQAELAKPAVSVDTLDHIGYQGRESRPEEVAPVPVAWAQNPKDGFWCWCLADEAGAIALYTHPAAPVPAVQSAARAIAAEQSYDTGLWSVATTATEAHLQAALRRLTAAVEREAP